MQNFQEQLNKMLKEVTWDSSENNIFDMTNYDIQNEVSQLIYDSRIQQGITQKKLSENSGVSQANISKIENGNYKISLYTLKKLADGLGKRLVIELVDYEEEL